LATIEIGIQYLVLILPCLYFFCLVILLYPGTQSTQCLPRALGDARTPKPTPSPSSPAAGHCGPNSGTLGHCGVTSQVYKGPELQHGFDARICGRTDWPDGTVWRFSRSSSCHGMSCRRANVCARRRGREIRRAEGKLLEEKELDARHFERRIFSTCSRGVLASPLSTIDILTVDSVSIRRANRPIALIAREGADVSTYLYIRPRCIPSARDETTRRKQDKHLTRPALILLPLASRLSPPVSRLPEVHPQCPSQPSS